MTKEEAFEKLRDKGLSLKEVFEIYEKFGGEIDGAVAMNLSMRTSVYERGEKADELMIKLLKKLAASEDMSARWAVAKNPFTPVSVLKELCKDPVNLVRALCATNPDTPVECLEKFFEDEKIVRDGLSGNPSTPVKYLSLLAEDEDKMVRLRVAENPSSTEEILKKLLNDNDKDVAKAAEIRIRKLKGEKS